MKNRVCSLQLLSAVFILLLSQFSYATFRHNNHHHNFQEWNLADTSWSVSYLGSVYDADANTTRFSYEVSADANGKGLSSWVLGMDTGKFDKPSSTPRKTRYGTDRITGIEGLKWKRGVKKGMTKIYTLTLDGNIGEASAEYGVAGRCIVNSDDDDDDDDDSDGDDDSGGDDDDDSSGDDDDDDSGGDDDNDDSGGDDDDDDDNNGGDDDDDDSGGDDDDDDDGSDNDDDDDDIQKCYAIGTITGPGDEILAPPAYSISGTITLYDLIGNTLGGIADVTIILETTSAVVLATTKTDADGNYAFAGVESGDYSVYIAFETPDDPDDFNEVLFFNFIPTSPPFNSVTVVDSDVSGVNFSFMSGEL